MRATVRVVLLVFLVLSLFSSTAIIPHSWLTVTIDAADTSAAMTSEIPRDLRSPASYRTQEPLPRSTDPPVASDNMLVQALSQAEDGQLAGRAVAATPAVAAATSAPDFGALPLSFVPNAGQSDDAVRFEMRGMGGTIFFTPHEVVLSLPSSPSDDVAPRRRPEIEDDVYASIAGFPAPSPVLRPSSVIRLRFEGANAAPDVTGGDLLPGTVNYFTGKDPDKWRTSLPTYAGIVYEELYPGIDLRYDGTQGVLKGTYTVAPGADPGRIRWRYDGAAGVRLDEATGDLLMELPSPHVPRAAGRECPTLTERAPVAYQEVNGRRVPVEVRYAMAGDGSVGFALGDYDPALPLVIDPTLTYSTFVGGSEEDRARGLAMDEAGNVVVTGYTYSANFPTTAGAYDTSHNGADDIFVLKLSADGGSLLYSTFVGGSDRDEAMALALDDAGNIVVTGRTWSSDFPTTSGAYDTSHNGGWGADVFVLKLSADGGSLLYSTFVGGSGGEYGEFGSALALDEVGNVVVTGGTQSADFPTTAGAYDTSYNEGFHDVFVLKLAADGSSLLYSTFVGGSGYDNSECAYALALDEAGHVVVTGFTESSDFPTTPGAYDTSHDGGHESADVFVLKLSGDGSSLLYSTFVGRSKSDYGRGLALDDGGNVVVIGETSSWDFPTTPGAYDTSYSGGWYDVFILKLSVDGSSLLYSTFVGGSEYDGASALALDNVGNVVAMGWTGSMDFPTTPDAYDRSHNGSEALSNVADQGLVGGAHRWDLGEQTPHDLFVLKLSVCGSSLLYSTFVGGSGFEYTNTLALDDAGNAVVSGSTPSSDFPTTPGAYDTSHNGNRDGFVLRFDGLGGPEADLSLTKSVTPTVVMPGEHITYTLTYKNNGPNPAGGVVITDVVPASIVTDIGYTNTGALITPTGSISYTRQVEDLSVGQGGVITMTGVVSPDLASDVIFTNTATITTTAFDPDATNNSATAAAIANLPRVYFSDSTYEQNEGVGMATITVTLDAAPFVTVTVEYATTDGTATAGSDYTATSGTLTFNPGETSKTFNVSIKEDSLDEGDETINLALSSPSHAALGTSASATLIITDNDPPTTVCWCPVIMSP